MTESSTSSTTTTSDVYVLYIDHQSHPVPLSCCYHATASRLLSSSVARYPPCSQTEIDSAFCPQCLSFHDASSAAALGGNCPRASCRRCPMCTAVATVYPDIAEKLCFYKCGYCTWTSKECNVIVEIALEEETKKMSKEQIVKCAEDLGEILQNKILQATQTADEHHGHMVTCYQKIFSDEERRERQGYDVNDTNPLRRGGSSSRNLNIPEQWSIDALEKSIKAKKDKLRQDTISMVGGREPERILFDVEGDDDADDAVVAAYLKGVSKQAIDLQAALTSLVPESRADFYPLPIPLRTRKSRRCRAELQNGRPGILVKPKLNPLEGDTSLRSGHGQWWKKDSSAIHVVPRVKVVRHGSVAKDDADTSNQYHAFLLRVKNPTLGKVRVRFCQSTYKGEVGWDSGNSEGDEEKNELLENMLVNTISGKKITAKLEPTATKDVTKTDVVELDSVEDAFLELGKKQTKNPTEVLEWDVSACATALLGGDKGAGSSSIRLIAKQSDSAWFEFACLDTTSDGSAIYNAVPIALQIQVGDGSWESSLVKPLPTKDNEPDFVSFDIVVTWKNK